jgi:hypothetical protein
VIFRSQGTGRKFAMKTVKKQPKLLRYITTETKILQEINHVSCQVLSKVIEPGFIRMLAAKSDHDPSNIFWTISHKV